MLRCGLALSRGFWVTISKVCWDTPSYRVCRDYQELVEALYQQYVEPLYQVLAETLYQELVETLYQEYVETFYQEFVEKLLSRVYRDTLSRACWDSLSRAFWDTLSRVCWGFLSKARCDNNSRALVGWLCWGLTSQSTIFQSYRDGAIASWVINQYFRGVKCLAQGHNTAEVGLEPRTSRSGVRHSTTEPPRSPNSRACWDTLSRDYWYSIARELTERFCQELLATLVSVLHDYRYV